MPIYALFDVEPSIHETAYVHPDAVIIGDVHVGAQSSIWPTAVLRGDYQRITIGEGTSIQDGTVIHIGSEKATTVGSRCVVGHNAYLEGCTVEDDSLIGSMSVLLHDVHVGRGSTIGAGAVLTARTRVPERSMAVGVPATVRVGVVAVGAHSASAQRYIEISRRCIEGLRRIG